MIDVVSRLENGLYWTSYVLIWGIVSGLTKSTDHPSKVPRASEQPKTRTMLYIIWLLLEIGGPFSGCPCSSSLIILGSGPYWGLSFFQLWFTVHCPIKDFWKLWVLQS